MSKLYLAYGSNLNLQQMAYRCPTARVVATTYLEHYKLTFRGHNANAVATVEPSENNRVTDKKSNFYYILFIKSKLSIP